MAAPMYSVVLLVVAAVAGADVAPGLAADAHGMPATVSDVGVPPRRFRVSLDLPPIDRWTHIAAAYRQPYEAAVKALTRRWQVHLAIDVVEHALRSEGLVARLYPGELLGELRSIARGLNISTSRVAANSLLYDLTAAQKSPHAACTSIVAATHDGRVIHGRNLDYHQADTLKPLAILVDFVRAGEPEWSATVFAGMPTFNTAQKRGGCARRTPFSLSQDERDEGSLMANWLALATGSAPSTFASFRRVVEDACSFDEAVGMLEAVPLPASSYFVAAGSRPLEGAVITRARDRPVDVWRLGGGSALSGWYLLETNYDHWAPAPDSDRRRAVGERAMTRFTPANFSADGMLEVLSTWRADTARGERGIYNNKTVFSQVMLQPPPPAHGMLTVVVRGPWPHHRHHPITSSVTSQ